MKNKTLIILIFLLTFSLNHSQEKEQVTRVLYKVIKPEPIKSTEVKNPEIKKLLNEVSEEYKNIECELFYTQSKSLFKKINKLDLENKKAYQMASVFANGLYYKDLTSKEKIVQKELYGELYNKVVNFDEYNWTITNETKVISNYKCYKAIGYFEEFDKVRNRKNIFHPEVWFTPEIPAPFGPRGLDGLPGLVLEGKFNNHAYFYATTINFNYTNNEINNIQKPEKGKAVTPEEFQDIMSKGFNNIKLLND